MFRFRSISKCGDVTSDTRRRVNDCCRSGYSQTTSVLSHSREENNSSAIRDGPQFPKGFTCIFQPTTR